MNMRYSPRDFREFVYVIPRVKELNRGRPHSLLIFWNSLQLLKVRIKTVTCISFHVKILQEDETRDCVDTSVCFTSPNRRNSENKALSKNMKKLEFIGFWVKAITPSL